MDSVKWLVMLVLMGLCSKGAASQGIELSVFSLTSQSGLFRWTRFSGASSYKLSAALQSSPSTVIAFATYGPNTVLGSLNSLSPNFMYTITIDALDDGQTVLSSSALETSTAPEMMDPVQPIPTQDSRARTVTFIPKTGATGYILRVENTDGFYREDPVSSSPVQIKNLTPYTSYSVSIMAVNSGGRNQPSPPVSLKTVLPAPVVSTSSQSNDSITVSWSPVSGAVQYTTSIHKFNSSVIMKYNTSDTNLTISDLDAGALYTIKVTAQDLEGREGEPSSNANQMTRPPTPSSVTVSLLTSNGLRRLSVSWAVGPEVHPGSVQYHVMSDQNLTCNSTSSSCTLPPLGCGEVHTITVTATNEAGPSTPSSPELFITYPCAPESLSLVETQGGNCTLTWDKVSHADGYVTYIKRGDGTEMNCNTTDANNCTFHCECGYTYLMSVFAFNQVGSSPPGESYNYTTLPCCPEAVSVDSQSTDTLVITWSASRGAVLYETRAADSSDVILCNDTAPTCALSDLSCDSSYSVLVTPCSDISGCNRACKAHTKDTAPCMPTNLKLSHMSSSTVSVSWTAGNRDAVYTVSASTHGGTLTCVTAENNCSISGLPCGSTYEVSVRANNSAGSSLSSYSETMETGPCCPVNLTVIQKTQAVSEVSWSAAKGAYSFITTLTSTRGHARCHTQDSSCLMGCITCGTNYTVAMEAYSHSGSMTNCTYEGFSSSACCPSGVRLYRLGGNSLRIHWRSGGGSHSYVTDLLGSSNNYTCTASPGESSCDISNITCGGVYNVVVAPLTPEGGTVLFCPHRLYSVTCSGDTIATVIFRGKRSVD